MGYTLCLFFVYYSILYFFLGCHSTNECSLSTRPKRKWKCGTLILHNVRIFLFLKQILNLILWNFLTQNFNTTQRDFNDDTVFLFVCKIIISLSLSLSFLFTSFVLPCIKLFSRGQKMSIKSFYASLEFIRLSSLNDARLRFLKQKIFIFIQK